MVAASTAQETAVAAVLEESPDDEQEDSLNWKALTGISVSSGRLHWEQQYC